MEPSVWIGTSWKMTKTIEESREYLRVLARYEFPARVGPFVLPAHTSLAAAREVLPSGSRVLLGAQNAHWAAEGAGTGEISMRMAVDAGASLVEIGHSERRAWFGETDETVAWKVRAALDAGLTPLVCVGEPADARAAGKAVPFVAAQVTAALSAVAPAEVGGVLVAYEPVWAIGSAGRPASPEEVAPVMAAVAATAIEAGAGRGCRALLYGGSVDETNARDLLAVDHADGLFVGRAAWDVHGFLRLLHLAAEPTE